MAVSPENKAAAVAVLLKGGSVREAAKAAGGVSSATVQRWKEELEDKGIQAGEKARENEFAEKLYKLVLGTIDATSVLIDVVSDPLFVKGRPVEDIERLHDLIDKNGKRLLQLGRQPSESAGGHVPVAALPGAEPVEAELVDEDERAL